MFSWWSGFSQTTFPDAYKCTAKLDEWARWREVNVMIEISKDRITVNEIEGVELQLKYDKMVTNQTGAQFFMWKEQTRMTVTQNIITVFEDHYKCELKS